VPIRRVPREREICTGLGIDLRRGRTHTGCGSGNQRYATCETEHDIFFLAFP
jgi:hypothetical protein